MVTGDAGRLSEDLDFTNAGLPDDPEGLFHECFPQDQHGLHLGVRDPYRTGGRNWACHVSYRHEWDEAEFRPGISYREEPFLPAKRWTPVEQPYFSSLPFAAPQIPSRQVEEAVAEELRAIQQRATERDLYDAVRYGRKGFDQSLVRRLAVGKLWNDREAFDPDRILHTLAVGRREWPDLERSIGRARRKDWNREVRAAAKRFSFLTDLTPFEKLLMADARRHSLRGAPEREISRTRSARRLDR
jgi:predicted nucleotidyltransferase component of viral defense system